MNGIAGLYGTLTKDERHRLMLAALYRHDQTEFDRLNKYCNQVTYSVSDFDPFAEAIQFVCLQNYISLLAETSHFLGALYSTANYQLMSEIEAKETEPGEADENSSRFERDFHCDLALAHGYRLQIKVEAWTRFCERMNLPPFEIYEPFAGFVQVQRAIGMYKKIAFTSDQMLNWLNVHREPDEPEWTENSINVDAALAQIEKSFNEKIIGG